MTIHAAKGLEFDSVAIVDMYEGKMPFYRSTTAEELEEEKRKLYVAITRAKRILVYVADKEHYRNIPSRFLGSDHLGMFAH